MKHFLKQLIIFSIFFYPNFSQECPTQCNCSKTSSVFNVTCIESNSAIYRQNILIGLNSAIMETIIVRYLNIESVTNLCSFNKLSILDLSNNKIASNITGSTFSCLFELRILNLSTNLIRFINENAFDFNKKLLELDLSFNRIEHIPFNLFQYKLENLKKLYLQRNSLKEIDVWFFYLKQVELVDLRFNNIRQLKNDNNFMIDSEMIYPTLARADLIDLRYNLIEKFDDDILKLYNICNKTKYLFFIRLLYGLRIDENPLQCNCTTSFNFINYFISLNDFLNTDNNIFKAKCTNSKYQERIIFNFLNLNEEKDCLVDFAFTEANCPFIQTTPLPTTSTSNPITSTTEITTPTTTTVGFVIPQNLLNEPEKNLTQITLDYFNDGQTAGYIIGILGLVFIFFILIYFLCPIEILAICFNCFPCFYAICPCKSGVKREKEFDLFISFNKINEEWISKKLIPRIKQNYLVYNYTLHYNLENKTDEIFELDVKDRMNKSSCILFVLSDAFLINEWNNKEFRTHTEYLITRKGTRFVAIQMHDICDEEVDEYFTKKFKIPTFVSLENDEFFFWQKLAYFLSTNKIKGSIQPIVPINYFPKPNDDVVFDSLEIKTPIIHIPGNQIGETTYVIDEPKKKPYPDREKKKPSPGIQSTFEIPEKKYEIVRLNNQYFPINDENTDNRKKYHKINFDNSNESMKEEYVESLILKKDF